MDSTHHPSKATKDLLAAIGGRDRLLAVTSRFYPKMFRDRQLSLFVQNFEDPHPERLADWIAEKMSGRAYWSSQLSSRQPDQPQDRSHAHYLAWHSPKRPRSQWGDHFKLDDAIMWMRLMFWSCREEGLDSEPFLGWYRQFIGHFIRVYSSKAPPFVLAAVEWSLDPANLGKYEADGWLMKDVAGMGRNPLYSWRTSEQVFKCLQSSVLLLDDALRREIQQVFGRRPPAEIGEGISLVSGTLY